MSRSKRLSAILAAAMLTVLLCGAGTSGPENNPGVAPPAPSAASLAAEAVGGTWLDIYAGFSERTPTLIVSVSRLDESPDASDIAISFTWTDAHGDTVAEHSVVMDSGSVTDALELTPKMTGNPSEVTVKAFRCAIAATSNGRPVQVFGNELDFFVCITPAGQITVRGPIEPVPGETQMPAYYSYIQGLTDAPDLMVRLIGAVDGADIDCAWRDENGEVLQSGPGTTFVPRQLGTTPAVFSYSCTVTAEDAEGVPIHVNNSVTEFQVGICDPDHLFAVDGPGTIATGETISVVVDAGNLAGASGSVRTTGLQIVSVTGGISTASDMILIRNYGGTRAAYTCRVTAAAGSDVSFAIIDAVASSGERDYGVPGAEWSATASSPAPPPEPVRPSLAVSAAESAQYWQIGTVSLPVLRVSASVTEGSVQTVRYEWTDDAGRIIGENSPTLQLTASDLGTSPGPRTFSCSVSAAAADGTAALVTGSPVSFTVYVTAQSVVQPLPGGAAEDSPSLPPIPPPAPPVLNPASPVPNPGPTGGPTSGTASPGSADGHPQTTVTASQDTATNPPAAVPASQTIPGSRLELAQTAGAVAEDLEVVKPRWSSKSYLTGIPVGRGSSFISVQDLRACIAAPQGGSVEIQDSDRRPASPSAPVATGMRLIVRDNAGAIVERITIVVPGDVTGSGEMNLTQLVRMAAALVGIEPLQGPYLAAADIDGNGRLTLTDLVQETLLYSAAA